MHLNSIGGQRLARIKGRARAASERPDYSKARAYLEPLVTSEDAAEPVDPAERRRHKRVHLQSAAIVRRIGAHNFEVALEDISAGGCRVVMMEPAEIGDPVIARMPQLEPLGSRVSWAEGKVAGVEFLKTIHPAVFEMLLSRLSEDQASAS
jgi:hypothetical protein